MTPGTAKGLVEALETATQLAIDAHRKLSALENALVTYNPALLWTYQKRQGEGWQNPTLPDFAALHSQLTAEPSNFMNRLCALFSRISHLVRPTWL